MKLNQLFPYICENAIDTEDRTQQYDILRFVLDYRDDLDIENHVCALSPINRSKISHTVAEGLGLPMEEVMYHLGCMYDYWAIDHVSDGTCTTIQDLDEPLVVKMTNILNLVWLNSILLALGVAVCTKILLTQSECTMT